MKRLLVLLYLGCEDNQNRFIIYCQSCFFIFGNLKFTDMDTTCGNQSKILQTCYFTRSTEGEQFINEHVFSYQIAGTLTVNDGRKTYTSNAGDFRLSKRNQLAEFEKTSPVKRGV